MSLLAEVVRERRRALQWLYVSVLYWTGCIAFAKLMFRRQGSIVVLTLHRVLDGVDIPRTNSPTGMVIARSTYDQLCRYISRKYLPVVRVSAAPGSVTSKLQVLVTFDDGWADNLSIAAPIASSHGISVTIFLCSSLMGRRSPFWPEKVVAAHRALRPVEDQEEMLTRFKALTKLERETELAELERQVGPVAGADVDATVSWKESRRAAANGVTFGSHTATHELLSNLTEADVRRELLESRQEIGYQLGFDCRWLSYPNGQFDKRVMRIAAEAGYTHAFTTQRGVWSERTDPLAIPRCNIYEHNVVNPWGRFSPAMFEYTTVFKAWLARSESPHAPERYDEFKATVGRTA